MENELKLSELCEEWALANSRECVESGGTAASTHEESEDASEARFTLKYLGSTLVETPSSEEATAEAIKTVITMVRFTVYTARILTTCTYIYLPRLIHRSFDSNYVASDSKHLAILIKGHRWSSTALHLSPLSSLIYS